MDAADPAGESPEGTTRTDGAPDGGIPDMGYHYRIPVPLAGLFLVFGPGPGAANPPLVRLFAPAAHAAYELQFEAYGVPRFGVNVAAGDLDGDGNDEIVSGPGPSPDFSAHIRGWDWDGSALTSIPGFGFYGRAGIVVSGGPNQDPVYQSHVWVYEYDGADVEYRYMIDPFPGLTHGTTLAAARF